MYVQNCLFQWGARRKKEGKKMGEDEEKEEERKEQTRLRVTKIGKSSNNNINKTCSFISVFTYKKK